MKTADPIAKGLWMGGFPPGGKGLADLGFHCLVLMAEELQPPAKDYPGLEVFHAPIDDDTEGIPDKDMDHILAAITRVLDWRKERKNVLVTCHEGRNRSGLICGLALMKQGATPAEAVQRIRAARGEHALRNPQFVKLLEDVGKKEAPEAEASGAARSAG